MPFDLHTQHDQAVRCFSLKNRGGEEEVYDRDIRVADITPLIFVACRLAPTLMIWSQRKR